MPPHQPARWRGFEGRVSRPEPTYSASLSAVPKPTPVGLVGLVLLGAGLARLLWPKALPRWSIEMFADRLTTEQCGIGILFCQNVAVRSLSRIPTSLAPAPIFAALFFMLAHNAYPQAEQPTPNLVAVSLNAVTGAISVGNQLYSPSTTPSLNIVALTRQSNLAQRGNVKLIANQTAINAAAANEFLQDILANNPDAILVLNAVGDYGFALNQIAKNLERFGAFTDIEAVGHVIPFTFVGSGGLAIGQAHQTSSSSLNTAGYFAQDSNGNYTFIQPDYRKFNLANDGTISIGLATYPSGTCSYVGFHVVVVPRDAPESAPLWNKLYCNADLVSVAQDLQGQGTNKHDFTSDESALVFLTTVRPLPAYDWFNSAAAASLGKAFAKLGGYYETIGYSNNNDTYALVGSAAPPVGTPGATQRGRETSSVYPGHPRAGFAGVLGRGRRGNWYSPITTDNTGIANLDFYSIMGQNPVPFPVPSNAAEQTAFTYISTQICGNGCNIRDAYWNTNIALDAWQNTLERLTDPATGKNCSNAASSAFCKVQIQLDTELKYALDTRAFNRNLETVWLASGSVSILDLLKVFDTVQAQIQAPPTSQTVPIVENSVNSFLALGTYVGGPAAPVFGVVDVAFNFGLNLATELNGNPTSSLSIPVADLESSAADSFTQQGKTLGTQFDLIFQDWGRLQALGKALESQAPGWTWNGDVTTAQVLQRLKPIFERSFYRSVMAAEFAIGYYTPEHFYPPGYSFSGYEQEPSRYSVCFNGCQTPFSSSYAPYGDPNDSGGRALDPGTQTLRTDGGWQALSRRDTPADPYSLPNQNYEPPGDTFMAHLFSTTNNGLGVYRPELFDRWEFPRVVCKQTYHHGCNWSAAAPPIESVPNPLTKVSITLDKTSVHGTAIDAAFTVTNSGTTVADTVTISQISLVALAGSGQTVLLSPLLPIVTDGLLPGTAFTAAVRLNVPATVKKLQVTENGTVQIGSSLQQFSSSQVIFP